MLFPRPLSRNSRLALGTLALTLSAAASTLGCGSSSSSIDQSPPAPGYTVVGTTTNVAACNTDASATLLRCTAPTTTTPRLALGVCGDLVVNNVLTLDQTGSNVEVSGATTSGGTIDIDGNFAGLGSVTVDNPATFAGSFATAGDLTANAPVTVGGNADIGGTAKTSSALTVGGTETMNATGVTLDLACSSAPDVAALVKAAATKQDAAADAALPSNSLVNVDSPTELTLGCGQYTLDSLGVNDALTLHVTGTTSLVVTGDVNVTAPLVIDLKDGAALDLAIGGNLTVNNTMSVGTLADSSGVSTASATWVGVGGTMTLGSSLTLAGSLLVNGLATVDNGLDVTGSAFVGGLSAGAGVSVHLTPGAPAMAPNGCTIPGEVGKVMSRSR